MNTPAGVAGPAACRLERTARRASGYERDGLAPVLAHLQRQALAELRLRPTDRFLDVGCATGAAVRLAAARVPFAAGIDRSPAMIAHAHKLAADCSAAHFAVADATGLPFPRRSFTAILCTSVLHYVDDPAFALRELVRVADVDGRIVIGQLQPGRSAPGLGDATAGPSVTVTDSRQIATLIGTYTILVVRPHPAASRAPAAPGGDWAAVPWGFWRLPVPPV